MKKRTKKHFTLLKHRSDEMEKLIKEYEQLYQAIARRIYELKKKYNTEFLMTMERQNLKARIDLLEEERFELVQTTAELKRHR
ncbi:MAG: hypothetical protein K2J88_02600, partial [Oscillospiraceae bacterium]|nr:hypothetical protein [Oscillospiraceae bacterium]